MENAPHTESTEAGARSRQEILFWLTAGLLLFLYLGRNALWASEDRWAEVVREMLLTGDFWHPAINGQVYFDKPLLTYWLILPFAWLCGGVTELACRLPSAVSALAALWVTRRFGQQLFGRETGRIAGWVLLGCYGVLFWSRTAAADVENMTAIVLAAAWFFAVEKQAKFLHYLLFYLIIFLGALCKGLPALVMPVAFIIPYLFLAKRWKAHWNWRNVSAFLLSLAVYSVPFFIAYKLRLAEGLTAQTVNGAAATSGWELVWRENVVRVFNAFDHKDPFYSYLYELPRILLPWTPFFLTGLAALSWKWRKLDERQKGLLLGMAVVFLLFSASQSRRWYYILPLAPFCAIVTAAGLTPPFGWKELNRRMLQVSWYLLVTAASLATAAFILLPLNGRLFDFTLPLPVLIGTPVAGLIILTAMMAGKQPDSLLHQAISPREKLSEIIFGITVAVGLVLSVIWPAMTLHRTEKNFCLQLRNELKEIPPQRQLFLFSEANPKYLFYAKLPQPVPVLFGDEKKMRDGISKFCRDNAQRKVAIFCTSRKRDLEALKRLTEAGLLPLDPKSPTFREPVGKLEKASSRKQLVWVIDLPAAPDRRQASEKISKPSIPQENTK